MSKEANIKSVLVIGLLVLLSLPLIQSQFGLFKELPLHGSFDQPANAEFSIDTWFDGAFQKQKDEYVNVNFGFRNRFVHLYSQLDYSLFSNIRANGVLTPFDSC